jgi:hypothetical protein
MVNPEQEQVEECPGCRHDTIKCEEHAKPDCPHICSGNCRRSGCDTNGCVCGGEFHEVTD